MRFISGSANSSMKQVSVWLNRVLSELLPEVDMLFADCAKNAGVAQDYPWAAQSWIL